jgi:hypothetical protein
MIRYHGRLEDFWSTDLLTFIFDSKVKTSQREYFHKNFSRDSADLFQTFDDKLPNCRTKFYEVLHIQQGSISWISLEPNQVVPVHQDNFYAFRQAHNVDVSQCVRYLVMLNDWELGQIVQIGDQILTKWQSGDTWCFNSEELHWAANGSSSNFVSCQVSGVVNDI